MKFAKEIIEKGIKGKNARGETTYTLGWKRLIDKGDYYRYAGLKSGNTYIIMKEGK